MEEEKHFIFIFLKNGWCPNRQKAVEDGSGKMCECEDQFEKNREAWSWGSIRDNRRETDDLYSLLGFYIRKCLLMVFSLLSNSTIFNVLCLQKGNMKELIQ